MKNLSVLQWIGLGFSIAGTICGVIFIVSWFKGSEIVIMAGIAFLCALISYILYTIKAAFGVAKTMWFIVPYFPVDLVLGALGFFFGLYFLFFVPVFFVIKSIRTKQAQKSLE